MTRLSDGAFDWRPSFYWYLTSILLISPFQEVEPHSMSDALLEIKIGENCEQLLEQFATITANFTRCVIRHARPIVICLNCINEFYDVVKSHDNILKLHEDSGEACKKELLNVDRLNLIENSFQFVNEQWSNAACEKCYVQGKNTSWLNPNTTKIFKMYNKTETCFKTSQRNNSSSLCDDCKNVYRMLNNFYEEQRTHGGFCVDVIDMMNNTRYEWSRSYNCSPISEKSGIALLLSSTIVCMLPILFYFLIWLFSTFNFPEISTQNRWNGRFTRLNSNQEDS